MEKSGNVQGLQGAAGGYRGLQGAARGCRGLHGAGEGGEAWFQAKSHRTGRIERAAGEIWVDKQISETFFHKSTFGSCTPGDINTS